jgi:hypothetical protein
MKIEMLHLGMKVCHPQYGVGEVKSLAGQMAEVAFIDAVRSVSPELSGLTPAEPRAELSGLAVPLRQLIEQITDALLEKMGWEKSDFVVEELGARWLNGKMLLQPADAKLQAKEVPLEVFFHKIVMMRNNLRCLEQKINGSDRLSEADKVELQQYITRCYGSMTTFNLLFKSKEGQFAGAASG